MVTTKETSIPSVLSLVCVFLTVFHPCAAASFDAKSAFGWIDSSCTNQMSRINDAGDDYNKLAQAGFDSVKTGIKPPTKLGQLTLKAYLGMDLAFGIKGKMTQLQQAFVDQKLSLYCDGSAFEWVTEYQEGLQKGQPLVGPEFRNNGAWHSKEGRYKPNTDALYISGEKTDQRKDFCQDPTGKNALGVSSINGRTVVLCPDAFKDPIRQTIPTTKQENMVGLDSLQSTGSILFHEITHCILGTIDIENGYGPVRTIAIASISGTQSAQKNAENWLYYAMAVYASQNAWVFGLAEDTNAYADTAATQTPAKRQLASPFPTVSLAEPLIRTPLPSPQAPTSSPAEKAIPILGTSSAPGPSALISAASNPESPTPSSNTLPSNTPPASGIPPSKPSAEYSPLSSVAPTIPPVDNTPFSTPPSGTPLPINPLSGNPPSGKPPSGDPPSGNPPSGSPPSSNPPSGKPPPGNPPSSNPPSGNPPSGNPPSGNPPSGNPPSGNPPSGDPPSGNPPSNNPPTNNPPTNNNNNNNNDNNNNNQKSQSKEDASVTSHSPSTTSSPSSSTSSASSANYNIESAVIYAEGSDTIRGFRKPYTDNISDLAPNNFSTGCHVLRIVLHGSGKSQILQRRINCVFLQQRADVFANGNAFEYGGALRLYSTPSIPNPFIGDGP